MKSLFKYLLVVCLSFTLFAEDGHMCSFPKISLAELVRYTGKVAKVNFIADESILDFDVVFISHKMRSSEELLSDLFSLLEEYDLEAEQKGNSYVIRKAKESSADSFNSDDQFFIYKLKYHQGEEVLPLLQTASLSLNENVESDLLLKKSISTLQWIKTSNSLFYSGNKETNKRMQNLVDQIDAPLKQVYVEVLVIETDINHGGEFGVSWKDTPSADILTATKNALTGGLDTTIIGDIIVNGKNIFNELSSFVRYINSDTKTSIVLNQKILARENKLSTIFEGDNVPFAGSVVELTGTNERRTSNIEYKDIGVNLQITPMISDSGIVTLTIDEQITESHNHLIDSASGLSGIKTSKTQMTTEAHVPNDHFLVLSGMTRKVKTKRRTGPPILRSIPLLKQLFTSKKEVELKKSLIIYVRPHIVNDLHAETSLLQDQSVSAMSTDSK